MTPADLNAELAAYLDEVTAPFPEDSAARIRADLTGHVLEAVAPGEPDAAAIREAVAALGPAAEVRAALEGQFFTRADVAWLERDGQLRRLLAGGATAPAPLWQSALGCVAVVTLTVFAGYAVIASGHGHGAAFAVAAVPYVVLAVGLGAVRWGGRRSARCSPV